MLLISVARPGRRGDRRGDDDVFVITLGVIAAVGAGLSLVPGLAYLKLDDQGFVVKKIGKRWGALWIDKVEQFEAT